MKLVFPRFKRRTYHGKRTEERFLTEIRWAKQIREKMALLNRKMVKL